MGPRPMEVVLAGAASCSAVDVVTILRKNGQSIEACTVAATAERAPSDPKVFTRIHMRYSVRGRQVKRTLVENAVRLSHQKYCSASAMLAKTAEMTHEFEIVPSEADQT